MNTTLYQNRPWETYNWTNLHLETHDYRIYYVNIDLRHQYGISVAESQTFPLAKCPFAGQTIIFHLLMTNHLSCPWLHIMLLMIIKLLNVTQPLQRSGGSIISMYTDEDVKLVKELRRKELLVSPTVPPSLWTMKRKILRKVGDTSFIPKRKHRYGFPHPLLLLFVRYF